MFTTQKSSVPREPPAGKPSVLETVLPGGKTVVCITLADMSNEEQQAFAEECYRVLSSQILPFAVIMNFRHMTDYPARQREKYAEVRERLRAVYESKHKLTVYLIDSDKQRGWVTAVGWKAHASATSGRIFTRDWQHAFELCKQALTG